MRTSSTRAAQAPQIIANRCNCSDMHPTWVRGGYNQTAPATGRVPPVAGAALVSPQSDVGFDLARGIRGEWTHPPLRECHDQILNEALELIAPAERRTVA